MADWEPEETKVTISQRANLEVSSPPTVKQDGNTCEAEDCDLTTNLWLNLTDGRIFCGQPQRNGTGGGGHAKAHFEATKHPLVVKLGTICADGADVVSYEEGDNLVVDPQLCAHLMHFGLAMGECKKSEDSMKELELAAPAP